MAGSGHGAHTLMYGLVKNCVADQSMQKDK